MDGLLRAVRLQVADDIIRNFQNGSSSWMLREEWRMRSAPQLSGMHRSYAYNIETRGKGYVQRRTRQQQQPSRRAAIPRRGNRRGK